MRSKYTEGAITIHEMISERKVKKKLKGIYLMGSNNTLSDVKHKENNARIKK